MRRSKNSGHDYGRSRREDLTEKRRDICSLFFAQKERKPIQKARKNYTSSQEIRRKTRIFLYEITENITDVIDTYVFRSLLQNSNLGMTAAASFYQSVICFATIMIVNAVVKHVEEDLALF